MIVAALIVSVILGYQIEHKSYMTQIEIQDFFGFMS
jgi:hypothetical protein